LTIIKKANTKFRSVELAEKLLFLTFVAFFNFQIMSDEALISLWHNVLSHRIIVLLKEGSWLRLVHIMQFVIQPSRIKEIRKE